MCEQSPIHYKQGDVVWVKPGICWWPGEVTEFECLPEDVQASLVNNKPIVSVKFFTEDSYEFVKNLNKIYSYNCTRKDDFIKKGMDMFRSKNTFMSKFPSDICTAEKKTKGNPKILEDPKYGPNNKVAQNIKSDIALIFGSSPQNKKKTPAKRSLKSSASRKSTPKKVPHITHPRYLGIIKDHEVRVLTPPAPVQKDDESPPETIYTCQTCKFTSTRINVIVLHNKSHFQGNYTPVQSSKKGKRSPAAKKSPKKSFGIPVCKTNTIDEDIALLEQGIALYDDNDYSDLDEDEEFEILKRKPKSDGRRKSGKKKPSHWKDSENSDYEDEVLTKNKSTKRRSQNKDSLDEESDVDDKIRKSKSAEKKKAVGKKKKVEEKDTENNSTEEEFGVTKRKQKGNVKRKSSKKKSDVKEDKVPEAKKDIRVDLLAEWDDIEDEEEESIVNEKPSVENKSKNTIEQKVEPLPEEKADKVADNSCFDFNEDEEKEVISSLDRKMPHIEKRKSVDNVKLPTDEVKKSAENKSDKAEDSSEKVDPDLEAFNAVLEATSVPLVEIEVPQVLKCEQNFHNTRTIKFPDKNDEVAKTEVATKLTNPKKRFVKSFEDFEQSLKIAQEEDKVQKKIEEVEEKVTRTAECDDQNSKVTSETPMKEEKKTLLGEKIDELIQKYVTPNEEPKELENISNDQITTKQDSPVPVKEAVLEVKTTNLIPNKSIEISIDIPEFDENQKPETDSIGDKEIKLPVEEPKQDKVQPTVEELKEDKVMVRPRRGRSSYRFSEESNTKETLKGKPEQSTDVSKIKQKTKADHEKEEKLADKVLNTVEEEDKKTKIEEETKDNFDITGIKHKKFFKSRNNKETSKLSETKNKEEVMTKIEDKLAIPEDNVDEVKHKKISKGKEKKEEIPDKKVEEKKNEMVLEQKKAVEEEHVEDSRQKRTLRGKKPDETKQEAIEDKKPKKSLKGKLAEDITPETSVEKTNKTSEVGIIKESQRSSRKDVPEKIVTGEIEHTSERSLRKSKRLSQEAVIEYPIQLEEILTKSRRGKRKISETDKLEAGTSKKVDMKSDETKEANTLGIKVESTEKDKRKVDEDKVTTKEELNQNLTKDVDFKDNVVEEVLIKKKKGRPKKHKPAPELEKSIKDSIEVETSKTVESKIEKAIQECQKTEHTPNEPKKDSNTDNQKEEVLTKTEAKKKKDKEETKEKDPKELLPKREVKSRAFEDDSNIKEEQTKTEEMITNISASTKEQVSADTQNNTDAQIKATDEVSPQISSPKKELRSEIHSDGGKDENNLVKEPPSKKEKKTNKKDENKNKDKKTISDETELHKILAPKVVREYELRVDKNKKETQKEEVQESIEKITSHKKQHKETSLVECSKEQKIDTNPAEKPDETKDSVKTETEKITLEVTSPKQERRSEVCVEKNNKDDENIVVKEVIQKTVSPKKEDVKIQLDVKRSDKVEREKAASQKEENNRVLSDQIEIELPLSPSRKRQKKLGEEDFKVTQELIISKKIEQSPSKQHRRELPLHKKRLTCYSNQTNYQTSKVAKEKQLSETSIEEVPQSFSKDLSLENVISSKQNASPSKVDNEVSPLVSNLKSRLMTKLNEAPKPESPPRIDSPKPEPQRMELHITKPKKDSREMCISYVTGKSPLKKKKIKSEIKKDEKSNEISTRDEDVVNFEVTKKTGKKVYSNRSISEKASSETVAISNEKAVSNIESSLIDAEKLEDMEICEENKDSMQHIIETREISDLNKPEVKMDLPTKEVEAELVKPKSNEEISDDKESKVVSVTNLELENQISSDVCLKIVESEVVIKSDKEHSNVLETVIDEIAPQLEIEKLSVAVSEVPSVETSNESIHSEIEKSVIAQLVAENSETSALNTLATMSELSSIDMIPTKDEINIEKNLTVVSEYDLAHGQVEIAKIPIIEEGTVKSTTIASFSVDFTPPELMTKEQLIMRSIEKPKSKPISEENTNEKIEEEVSINTVEMEMAKLTDTSMDTSVTQPPQESTSSSKLLDILTDKQPKSINKSQLKITNPSFNTDIMKTKRPNLLIRQTIPGPSKLATKAKVSPEKALKIKESLITLPKENVVNKDSLLTNKKDSSIVHKESDLVSVQKISSKRSFEDFEDIDAFIIQKPVKRIPQETKPILKKTGPKCKPTILGHTIIKPGGEVIEKSQKEDTNVFDIDSMPIVLSDQILTPENIETMPIMIQEKQAPPAIIRKLIPQKILNKGVNPSSLTSTIRAQPSKTYSKIMKTSPSTILKQTPILNQPTKSSKFMIVTDAATPTSSTSKYTVGKRITKKTPTMMTSSKVQNIVQEPTGNKIMIVTNQQGQQSRVLLTPEQQRLMGYSTMKKNVVKNTPRDTKSPNIISQTIINPKGQITTSTPGISNFAKRARIETKNKILGQKLILQNSNPIKSSSGQPRTIIIKNPQGQTVKRIQGTDDALLEQQVAEQIEAINRAASLKAGIKPMAKKMPRKVLVESPKSTIQSRTQMILNASSQKSVPPLAPISPSSKKIELQIANRLKQKVAPPAVSSPTQIQVPVAATPPVVEEKPEEKKLVEKEKEPKRTPHQLVIQDAVGNQTTITEGQILALPSETVDGQPQSYMLVTLDETGNLTPLNNEALMSLDPNLNLGGDLGNMVLQIDQGNGAVEAAAVATTEEKVEVPSQEDPQLEIPVEVPAAVPELQELPIEQVVPEVSQEIVSQPEEVVPAPLPDNTMQAVACNINNGESNQQLIITGDPISAQKFIESLTEGNTDLANLIANAEGNILIHADGQQILINTDSDNQMLLTLNSDAPATTDSTEGSGNPIFASQAPKNQDILAAALADTDVFQQEQSIVPSSSKVQQSQLSPGGALYPMNVNNVLETSSMSSPIMTPLEVPSTNSKKIDDEADILTRVVSKNVDLPITITDPNISQTVAHQQIISGDLHSNLELPLAITDVTTVTTSEMSSPSFNYSLPTLDDSDKQFTSPISMPLLTEEPEEIVTTTVSETLPNDIIEKTVRDASKEYLLSTNNMCSINNQISSLSEPPPDMFDFEQNYDKEIIPAETANSPSTDDSCEIPVQPEIVTPGSPKRSYDGELESDSKKCKFD